MGINVIFNKTDYEISERKRELWDKYNRIIQWGRLHPLRFAEIFLGLQFTDHQKYVFMSTWQSKFAVWVMGRNSGKAACLDTPIYTCLKDKETQKKKREKKTIGDLKIGDKIYDEQGELTEVIHLNPVVFEKVYKVYFEDGEIIKCNGEHLWFCILKNKNECISYTFETQQIFQEFFKKDNNYSIFVPTAPFNDYLNDIKKIIKIEKTNEIKPMRCITVANDSGLFVCGEHNTVTHNSFLSAPYIMTRSILIPNHRTYIMSVTGNQSQETFKKMEDLAMGNIASVSGSTGVFLNELVKQNSGASGFVHDKNSYACELYNGSEVHSLNSVAKNIVGIRSNLNFYDEAGKIERDFFALTKPFTTQDTNFIAGKGINVDCYPLQFPNQIVLASSAEDIFTELWDSYLLGAKEMIMGNKDYFVCDIDCRFSLAPKMNGEPFKPLLTQAVIDDAIAKNEFRANREYFNKFDVSGGQDCLVNKATLMKCSYGYYPTFNYEDKKRYIIVYDPSSKLDNSVILVAELFRDEERGWMCKIVNCRNLIELTKGGEKKIIQKPEQIEILKKMILDYNGPGLDYENIEHIIIDAGAGGGGFDIAQFLMMGWDDEHKRKHVGIIDPNDKYCIEYQDNFPEAKEILTLANFTKDKVKMYEDTGDALNQGLIIFPKNATGQNEMEFEDVGDDGEPVFRYEKLIGENLRAITEIEMLKYELMATQKMKNTQTNKISFDLIPSKKNEGLHDDRADCMAMLCNYLMQLRAKDKLNSFKKEKADYSKLLTQKIKTQQSSNRFGGVNPFTNMGSNPFMN